MRVLQQVQQQLVQVQQENAQLQARLQATEQGLASGLGGMETEVLRALQSLPDALAKLGKKERGGLVDQRGLGKPYTLGEDAEEKFRVWASKLEDYVTGVFSGKSREVLEWAAGSEGNIVAEEIDKAYGTGADLKGVVFDLVENAPRGNGLEAWRMLHKKYDPATGGRKRIMLQALTNPDRAGYESLSNALERWKSLRGRYNKKKDQFGRRKDLPDSLAMNALEKLVPRELETHLLLNHSRFKTFEEMEAEVVTFMEAKTGSKMTVSGNFSKAAANEAVPMDVDSLVKAVSGSLSSLVKGKGKGAGKAQRFEGKCDNCGKVGHKKKDCWSKPQSMGRGKGASTRPMGPSQNKKFDGKCNNCGRTGHMKKDCWAAGGGAAGGKSKGKQKGKKKDAAALEEEPEGEANGLELCALSNNGTTMGGVSTCQEHEGQERGGWDKPEVAQVQPGHGRLGHGLSQEVQREAAGEGDLLQDGLGGVDQELWAGEGLRVRCRRSQTGVERAGHGCPQGADQRRSATSERVQHLDDLRRRNDHPEDAPGP